MKKSTIKIEFDNLDMAKQFLAYMSDAGGEYNFINLDDKQWEGYGSGTHACDGFEYDFDKLIMKAKMRELLKTK